MVTKASVDAELQKLRKEHSELVQKMETMQTQLIEQVVKATIRNLAPKDPIQAEVLWRLRRTRREFVYKKIIELLNNNHREIAELKYLIVNQGKYCSKATFYRYIENLQINNRISIAQINDKLMAVPKQQ